MISAPGSSPMFDFDALRTISGSCSPMSRKTAFSSRNDSVRQLIRSAMRDSADWKTGAR